MCKNTKVRHRWESMKTENPELYKLLKAKANKK